jgi:hypothetical protein
LAILGEASAEELCDIIDDLDQAAIERSLHWAG